MPTYEYECQMCDTVEDHFRTVEHRDDAPVCCKQRMTRLISRVMGFVQADVCYDSPMDGRAITSRQARIEDMARNDCIEYDPEMRKDNDRRIAESEARLEKSVGETIDREIAMMPARKREKLEAEMQGGVTVEPERRTAPTTPIKTDIHAP